MGNANRGMAAGSTAATAADRGSDRLQNLFETMVYHTDRGRRLAPSSPLLLPERVPVMIEGFDQAV